MRRFIRWLLLSLAVLPLALAALYIATMRYGDAGLYPAHDGEETFPVYLADHGYHAGLIVRRSDLDRFSLTLKDKTLSALFARYQAYEWIEIGWGDEQFYRFAPTISHVTASMALSALSGMNETTVLHVVGLSRAPEATFRNSDLQRIELSRSGVENLLRETAKTFATNQSGDPVELGRGIYGPSLFYRAQGRYSLLNTCNMWLGDLMTTAGLKVSPVAAITSTGLFVELRWRNDLAPRPALVTAGAP
jgi:uncharacterized protein (TIGR02117 family)